MILTATYNYGKLFGLLVTATTLYKTGITSVNIDVIYGHPTTYQAGEYYVKPATTLEVTYKWAEEECVSKGSDLFSVKRDMNLDLIFDQFAVNETWTGIVLREDRRMFLDVTDFPPLGYTKWEFIDYTGLNKDTFGENDGVILKRVYGVHKFAYVAVQKTANHRAFCIEKIPYNRKNGTVVAIKNMQHQFLTSAETLIRTVRASKIQTGSIIKALPKLPSNISIDTQKAFSLETEIETDILLLDLEQYKVQELLENIYDEKDISKAFITHSMFVSAVHRVEQALTGPLLHPVFYQRGMAS